MGRILNKRLMVSVADKADQTEVAVDSENGRKTRRGDERVLVLDLSVGDVVDIGSRWVAVLSSDDHRTAVLIASDGDKARILSAQIETEFVPKVWITRVLTGTSPKLRLKFEGPKSIPIKRRREYQLQDLTQAKREMDAAQAARRFVTSREVRAPPGAGSHRRKPPPTS
jgi:hypothetical protein